MNTLDALDPMSVIESPLFAESNLFSLRLFTITLFDGMNLLLVVSSALIDLSSFLRNLLSFPLLY